MITRREFIKLSLLTGAGLPFWQTACRQGGSPEIGLKEKAVIIGVDGLDPVLIGRMMKAGRLPHFSKLARSGVFSPLATSNPPQSPVAWSCLATGNNPGRHGLFDFLTRDPGTYMPELGILSHRSGFLRQSTFVNPRRSPALWNILSEAGIPATVLRWPITFPPTEISGTILAGLGVPDIRGELGSYTVYSDQTVKSGQPGHDRSVRIDFTNNQTITEISGPRVKGARKTAPAIIPLAITRKPETHQALLEIQGQTCLLDENQWSPWIHLKFKINPFQTMAGICRFVLNSADQPFSLYLSPLQIDPADPGYPISHPAAYAADLKKMFGDFHTLGIPEDTRALMDHHLDDDAFLDMCDTIMKEQETIFRHELENFSRGLLANVFFTTDRIQHIYWSASDPSHPAYHPEYAEKFNAVIEQYCRRMDDVLGDVMARTDADTLLIVCSDHGFTSFKQAVHVNSWLVENGFMTLHTMPAPGDHEGGPLFQYVDWEKTAAYALGLGGVYLNLKGREGKGVIDASDYTTTMNKLIDRIKQWQNPATGEKIILSARPAAGIYHGPHLHLAPDLVIGCNRGYRVSWQSALGGTPSVLMEANTGKWTGDHCVDPSLVPGVFFANRKFNTQNCSLLNIAPTVLRHFGLTADMDGKALMS